MAKLYMPGFVVDLDGDFEPNVVNSVVFLISATQMVATFLANYRGRPFMQGFSENKPLFYSLVFACFFYVLMSLDILPFLNESFELVRFPDSQFRNRFVLLVLCDMIGVFLWDKLSLFIFREPRLHDQKVPFSVCFSTSIQGWQIFCSWKWLFALTQIIVIQLSECLAHPIVLLNAITIVVHDRKVLPCLTMIKDSSLLVQIE
eukprot:TRINITY_DN20763_c0_g1_i1.p1 TRINITY_DN20763_c0_g1~~TRINITY_DN20763_c0_g1_i1.p1  ORF type:complete len:211 (+),score=28.19 TRINITY_DN20763_c0_g1_i1:26-634(+)